MIPLLAAAFVLQAKAGGLLPTPTPIAVPDDVRDWKGFKYLPDGPRTIDRGFPIAADWSAVKGEPAPNAAVWHTKVVLLERVDRPHERGPEFVWPGHHALLPLTVERIRRALPQLRALVADATGGAVDMTFDVAEETEPVTIDGDLDGVVKSYLTPRLNGGRYQAEDGVFRGPYQSVFVILPAGGVTVVPFEAQGSPVSVLGVPDVLGEEADGVLAAYMLEFWFEQANLRIEDTDMAQDAKVGTAFNWKAVALGRNVPTDVFLEGLGKAPSSIGPALRENPDPWEKGPRGVETKVRLTKDPKRGSVLVVEEGGTFRSGGVVLPRVEGKEIDSKTTPTFAFWMRSDAKDPIVLQFLGAAKTPHGVDNELPVRIGVDVPFAYDGAWHRVKIDLRPTRSITDIVIGPDATARSRIKDTFGSIVASFSDFELTTEPPDPKPAPEAPSSTSADPELRARWAATSGPSEDRRKLLRDPIDAVKANAAAAALARPDPADEPMLIEDALYTFEPAVFTPAMRALANAKTPTAMAALKQALRIAAAERARGLAAEILADSGDPNLAPTFVGLNQVHSREARIEAIHALAKLPGSEAALLRMAYLAQDDPEIKLAATSTADPNDDAQGRKLLWSAVNEPSDAVRLESLRRLSVSTVPAFRDEGLKGVRDDSVGVRIGLLQAWAAAPSPDVVPAIRVALKDPEPRVRAAALAALAASSTRIESKDVPFDDPDPRVQLAALRLAAAKSLTLSEETRAKLRQSPDPRVRAAAG